MVPKLEVNGVKGDCPSILPHHQRLFARETEVMMAISTKKDYVVALLECTNKVSTFDTLIQVVLFEWYMLFSIP